jgi:hypothetical protein
MDYWAGFDTFLVERQSSFRVRRTYKDYWCGFLIGRSGIQFAATASVKNQTIGVELYIQRPDGKSIFHSLLAEKAAIEVVVGEALEWQELPGKTASRIVKYRPANPENELSRPDQYVWMADLLEKFREAFYERVKGLNVALGPSEDDNDVSIGEA